MPSLFPFNCFFFTPCLGHFREIFFFGTGFCFWFVEWILSAKPCHGVTELRSVCVFVCVFVTELKCVCVCVYVCYRTKVYAFPGLWLARFFFPRVTGLRLASEAHVLLVVSWTKHIVTDRTTCGIGSTCTCVWTALPPLLTAGLGFRV